MVYNPDASFVGEVIDFGLSVGVVSPSLILKGADGSTLDIPWEKIGQAKDIILTKEIIDVSAHRKIDVEQVQTQPVQPQPAQQAQAARFCIKCGNPLTWIQQYHRYYCYNCKTYI